MSLPDSLILKYMELATDLPVEDVERYGSALASDDYNPRDAKAALASAIVRQFHGEQAARVAADTFQRVHGEGGLPAEMPEAALHPSSEYQSLNLVHDALQSAGISRSRSEIRRLISQRGVSLIDTANHDEPHVLESADVVLRFDDSDPGGSRVTSSPEGPWIVRPGAVLKIGKRQFVRLVS